MKAMLIASTAAFISTAAVAQQPVQLLTSIPSDSVTVTDYYKQNVYDPANNKIGTIEDVLVAKDGKIPAVIIGVGGFLGVGEKDVAVPFSALHPTNKDNTNRLVLDTTKDALKGAPGYKYDRTTTTWILAEK
jgi:sporulation protein YlmC with PRC-barrel domain